MRCRAQLSALYPLHVSGQDHEIILEIWFVLAHLSTLLTSKRKTKMRCRAQLSALYPLHVSGQDHEITLETRTF
jgi:hypothetical protein